MDKTIAMIGLGQMGGNMAARLIESGFDVAGFDISAQACDALVASGGKASASIRNAIAGRAAVMTSLPDPATVREAYLGEQGIVRHAAPGAIVMELSTIDPDTMREIGRAAAERGLRVVDCPVSGSPKDSRAGTLVMMLGGEQSDLEAADPYLSPLAQTRLFAGAVGAAKVVKIVNNMMSMGNVLVASEAFSLGVAAGVEPQRLYDVLSVSGGRSHHFVNRFKKALNGDFEPGFKLELGEKDLALGIDLGRAMKQPTPAASAVRELFALALAEGLRGKDIVALLWMYQRWTKDKPE